MRYIKSQPALLMWGWLFCSFFLCFPKSKKLHLPLSPSQAHSIIDDLYTNSYSLIDSKEATMISQHGGNATYGEITFSSLQELLNDLNLTKHDMFYDLGSGMGKVCLQVALTTPAKAFGIELSPTRLAYARKAAANVRKKHHLTLNKNICFKEGNIANAPLPNATVVYMCSTCYSDKLMLDITQNLASLKPGLRVLTLKELPQHPAFKFIKTYTLPMTWSSKSSIHLYVLQDPKKNTSE